MTVKTTKEMEMTAHENKIDINDAEYKRNKIKQYFDGHNQDATSLDIVARLAPPGYKYAFISILDEKSNPNLTAIYNAKRKGYREVPPTRHEELDMNISPQYALKIPCAIYKDFYIFEIEEFILEARDMKELQDNIARAEMARSGYNVNMGKGIHNIDDKTQINVEYGSIKDFIQRNDLNR